jgi:hypothetical protein
MCRRFEAGSRIPAHAHHAHRARGRREDPSGAGARTRDRRRRRNPRRVRSVGHRSDSAFVASAIAGLSDSRTSRRSTCRRARASRATVLHVAGAGQFRAGVERGAAGCGSPDIVASLRVMVTSRRRFACGESGSTRRTTRVGRRPQRRCRRPILARDSRGAPLRGAGSDVRPDFRLTSRTALR